MINIPARDKNIVTVPHPAVFGCQTPFIRVKNAFNLTPSRYEKAMKKLLEV